MDVLVSIIIPIYKVEKYLDQCIESIVNQEYKCIEIILVDDGSPDNCPRICDEWAKKDSRIKVIHQENKGLSKSREIGFSCSKGEFICFIDSDDYCNKELVSTVVDVLKKSSADIVVFDTYRVTEKGQEIGRTENFGEEELSPIEAIQKLISGDANNFFCNKAYRRNVLEGVEFIPDRLWEDIGTMYKVFLNAERIYFIPKPLYYYRQREGSIVSVINERALQDLFFVRTRRYNDLLSIDTHLAEMEFFNVAVSALRLYDRSLWAKIDEKYLNDALEFLENNRQKILSSKKDRNFWLFYKNRSLYNAFRKLKHKIGNILKRKRT